MKKFFSLCLAAAVLCLTLCGCINDDDNNTAADVSALEVLQAIWNDYPEEERFYAMGGDYENPVEDAPGANDVTQTENIEHRFGLPQTEAKKIDGAASLVHMMNTNTFTSGAFHVVEGADTAKIAQAIADELSRRNFMCGWPDSLVVLTVGNRTVISVFGAEDLVNGFVNHAQSVYPDAVINIEQSLIPD